MINSAAQHPGHPGRHQGQDPGPGGRRARHHLRPRHQEPGAVLAVQGGPGGQGDPRPQDLRLHRRLHRPLAARPPTSRAPTTRPSSRGCTRTCKFDSRWDKATGFRTSQVLAAPILFEKYLLGVLQLINKRGGGAFTPKDEEAAEELAKILGIAFYNQHRAARTQQALQVRRCWWTRGWSPRRTSRTRSATRA